MGAGLFFQYFKCKVLMRIGLKFGVSVLQSICSWKYLETCLLPRGGSISANIDIMDIMATPDRPICSETDRYNLKSEEK